MAVLITGCAGFIGSNLAASLKGELYGYDNFSTGLVSNLKRVKITLKDSIHDLKVDRIFHLGIPSSTGLYRNDRHNVTAAVRTTIDVLELARKNDAKVVYASSSSIYNGNPLPYKEDMPIQVTDFYTEARYYMERLFNLYSQFYGIKSVGLRMFSVYGKNDRGKGKLANVITQFALDMAADKQPIIYGDGHQRRDFIHVDDVAKAYIMAGSYDKTDIFNIGTGVSHSFNEVVELINQALNKSIKPVFITNPLQNYVGRTEADVTKAATLLKFRVQIPFEKGVKKYVESLK